MITVAKRSKYIFLERRQNALRLLSRVEEDRLHGEGFGLHRQ